MKLFVLIFSLLLSFLSAGRTEAESMSPSRETQYNVSECPSTERAVDFTRDRDICIHSCRDSLKGFLDGKEVEPQVDKAAQGGIIRLEVCYNADAAVAYAQLFDFSNYTYEPATGIVELRGSRAQTLIRKL